MFSRTILVITAWQKKWLKKRKASNDVLDVNVDDPDYEKINTLPGISYIPNSQPATSHLPPLAVETSNVSNVDAPENDKLQDAQPMPTTKDPEDKAGIPDHKSSSSCNLEQDPRIIPCSNELNQKNASSVPSNLLSNGNHVIIHERIQRQENQNNQDNQNLIKSNLKQKKLKSTSNSSKDDVKVSTSSLSRSRSEILIWPKYKQQLQQFDSPRASPIVHSSTYPADRSLQRSGVYRSDQNKRFSSSTPSVATRKAVVVSDEVIINSIVTSKVSSNHSENINSSNQVTEKSTNYNLENKNNEVNSVNFSILRPRRSSIHNKFSNLGINPSTHEIAVEPCLADGTALLKVSAKKKQQRNFRIDVEQGRILWDSKKSGKGKY